MLFWCLCCGSCVVCFQMFHDYRMFLCVFFVGWNWGRIMVSSGYLKICGDSKLTGEKSLVISWVQWRHHGIYPIEPALSMHIKIVVAIT